MKALAAIIAATAIPAAAGAMTLSSPDVQDGAAIKLEQVYGECGGGNLSPALVWSGAPAGTQSFALTLYDPDGGPHGWWHWLVANIPAHSTSLARGAAAQGAISLRNDFGNACYDGPCPPKGSGTHHYRFTIYAMPAGISIDPGASPARNGAAIDKAALAKATLTGTYER